MSKTYALKAETRNGTGKGAARAARRENKVPAVIYGDKKEPVSIVLPAKEINLEYRKGHMYTNLCNLGVDGKDHLVLARDVQVDPIKETVLHVDFLRVTAKTNIHVRVPVHFLNEDKCPGLTMHKGVLNIAHHEIEMICQATNIPEAIEIDLAGKEIGDAIHAQDVKFPAGAKPADTRNFTIAAVAAPRRVVEEAPAAAEGEAAAAGAEGEKAADAKKAEEKK